MARKRRRSPSSAKRIPRIRISSHTERVTLELPADMIQAFDDLARKIGVTRDALIKLRLADALAREGTWW